LGVVVCRRLQASVLRIMKIHLLFLGCFCYHSVATTTLAALLLVWNVAADDVVSLDAVAVSEEERSSTAAFSSSGDEWDRQQVEQQREEHISKLLSQDSSVYLDSNNQPRPSEEEEDIRSSDDYNEEKRFREYPDVETANMPLAADVLLDTNNNDDRTGEEDNSSSDCTTSDTDSSLFETTLVITHLVDAEMVLGGSNGEDDAGVKGEGPFSEQDIQEMEEMIQGAFNQKAQAMCVPFDTRLLQVHADRHRLNAEIAFQKENQQASVGYSYQGEGKGRSSDSTPDDEYGNGQVEASSSLVALPIRYRIKGVCQGCWKNSNEGLPLLFGDVAVSAVDDLVDTTPGPSTSNDDDMTTRESSGCPPNPVSMTRQEFQEALQMIINGNQLKTPLHLPRRMRLTSRSIIESMEQDSEPTSSRVPLDTQSIEEKDGVVHFTCEDDAVSIQSNLLLRLPGDWRDGGEGAINLTNVEDIFQETYNRLTYQLCDIPYFRKVQSTTATVEEMDTTTNATLVCFDVQAECRNNCATSHRLFEFEPDLQLSPNASLPSVPVLDTRDGGDSRNGTNVTNFATSPCACPANETQGLRAPTMEEFTAVFQQAVSLAVNASGNAVNNTDLADSSGEVQTVECDANIQEFETYAYVDLELGSGPLRPSEKLALEEAFRDLYNRLSYLSCDKFFRNIVEATLEDDDDIQRRVLQESAFEEYSLLEDDIFSNQSGHFNSTNSTNITTAMNSTNATLANTTAESNTRVLGGSFFKIQGSCRNCPVTESGSYQFV